MRQPLPADPAGGLWHRLPAVPFWSGRTLLAGTQELSQRGLGSALLRSLWISMHGGSPVRALQWGFRAHIQNRMGFTDNCRRDWVRWSQLPLRDSSE